jgi:uncharacterized membrane protein (UPF0127 family)
MSPQVAPVRRLLLLLGFALGLTAIAGAQPEPPPLDLATYPRTVLTLTQLKPAAVHEFRVWVADTEPRAQQGLMFVRDLPESEGMIFPLEPPRVETMWMKNTYVELDMLFIDAAGRVVKIIEHAHPLSLDTLSSGGPVSAVLELKGGLAAKLGLQAGDKVSWKKPAP